MRIGGGAGTIVGAIILQCLGAACARMEPPPGGPPDPLGPKLVSVRPESTVVVPRFDGDVEFRFDEVISEGSSPNVGTGSGTLEKLILLSPSTRPARVSWKRSRITVSPAEGWQPNRVYRIQLLPGITDLRNNRADTGTIVTFSTGAPLPATTLTGRVIDWTNRRPVQGALVVAVLRPDSLPYRAYADSTGTFTLGPLPEGEYIVYGVLDQNRDGQHGLREAYDSIRLTRGTVDAGELWTFVHDSAPPRIQTAVVNDSVSATITFAQMLHPGTVLSPAAVRLRRLPDSASVTVASFLPKPADDSIQRARAAADTVRPDSVKVPVPRPQDPAAGELTSRPALNDKLILRVAQPWKPGDRFVVEISGVRNVTGTTGNTQGVLIVPEVKANPLDSLKLPLPKPAPTPSP